MLPLRLLLAALAGGSVAGAPCAAAAFGTHPPVSVQSCAVDATHDPPQFGPFAPMAWLATDVDLTFVNNTAVTATHVQMVVAYDGVLDRIDSVGTFAPGTRVVRTDSLAPFVDPKHVSCGISEVDFTDGSSWKPGPPGRKAEPR